VLPSANDLTHIDAAIDQRPDGAVLVDANSHKSPRSTNSTDAPASSNISTTDARPPSSPTHGKKRAAQHNAVFLTHINNVEIRLASEQQCKHVVEATVGSSMTRRPASLISFVNRALARKRMSTISFRTEASCVDESRRLAGRGKRALTSTKPREINDSTDW
jgi:hypothetical protein